jgi:hypothetical protein
VTRNRDDVTDQEWLAQRFESHRTHLRAVAYRMLGSLAEADDAVQEAWIRLSRTDTSDVMLQSGAAVPTPVVPLTTSRWVPLPLDVWSLPLLRLGGPELSGTGPSR